MILKEVFVQDLLKKDVPRINFETPAHYKVLVMERHIKQNFTL